MAHEPNGLNWQAELLEQVSRGVEADEYWREHFVYQHDANYSLPAIHLAMFIEPYLGFLLDGTKTVESRFSRKCCPPYNCLNSGDTILLKRSGGPVLGICQASSVWKYRLDAESWSEVRRFEAALCVTSQDFWEQRAEASFATLMRVEHVFKLEPIFCGKRDRRGWAGLKPISEQLQLREIDL